MTQFTIVNNTDELFNEIDKKRSEGYENYELTVLSRTKLKDERIHDSEISLIVTSGTFSDAMAKMLTGEDSEGAVLANYDLSEEEQERYKKEILNDKLILVASKDESNHKEVEDNNAAYTDEEVNDQDRDEHYAEESEGPKS
ncbi:general stress protein [Staphylococcus pettenkoferi]|uniref:general stress protein n=1 Tax=Staphylococcus pettenkoferi TaxID=170573 RepID=UPI00066B4529|nr:general stress protein [Staphylococcus pettenkoferi]MCI2803688.1 general stress protein [Staphylococcus pettenkoferi]MCY1574605.1 general stress protein [Staphylococcus pettenkoferi]MCY1578073.1 general stress protein [Staphylococcus pettenkoferi]MCY1615149.1 general stress protein [Staphylococcus pettenkoferi]UIK47059.1 general stress protein [Staphylococcus pettenkoferi]